MMGLPQSSAVPLGLVVAGGCVAAVAMVLHWVVARSTRARTAHTGAAAEMRPFAGARLSLEGHALAAVRPLLSPCWRQPCVAYEVIVERVWERAESTLFGRRVIRGSDTIRQLRAGSVFALDDGSGPIQVDATAEATFDDFKTGFAKAFGGVHPRLFLGDLTVEPPPAWDEGKQTIGFRAVERYVPAQGRYRVVARVEPTARGPVRTWVLRSQEHTRRLLWLRRGRLVFAVAGAVLLASSIPVSLRSRIAAHPAPSEACGENQRGSCPPVRPSQSSVHRPTKPAFARASPGAPGFERHLGDAD